MATDSVEGVKKGLSGWTKGSLIVLGLALLGGGVWYNWDKLRYGETTDVWKEIYQDQFSDLPKDLQKKIASQYQGLATNDPSKKEGIKSFDWDNENEILFITFYDGSKHTWKKVQSGNSTYWASDHESLGLLPNQISAIQNDFITQYGNGVPKVTKVDVVDDKNVNVTFEDGTSFPYNKNTGKWEIGRAHV